MKRIEVKLSLPVVAPLLDVMKTVADSLQDRLAVPLEHVEVDEDMHEVWNADLLVTQKDGLSRLLAMFDKEFFESGMIAFDEENAEPILRACAALRLRMREQYLKNFGDESLESGDVEIDELPEPMRPVFMCYVFLATIQELIIQHLDSEILEG
ncbi:hypothetical protein CMV30_02795 [Nibricoccus aquaticus]|uniref:DUF2017 domain-containing protein n=2 Tax=Nibricoccus aquaticus TaxID=2576891 RepID=A0A290Q3V5_9BACT|nr:hypothetical protein CMV30_02795 [Nibricoccus aquaticus]